MVDQWFVEHGRTCFLIVSIMMVVATKWVVQWHASRSKSDIGGVIPLEWESFWTYYERPFSVCWILCGLWGDGLCVAGLLGISLDPIIALVD